MTMCLEALILCLMPANVAVEADHVSHTLQHAPFTNHPTEYGADILGLAATWEYKRVRLVIAEGAVLEACHYGECAALWGPREVFQARLSYRIWTK